MPVWKKCEVCGGEYKVKPSHVEKRHTCGKQCFRELRREQMTGERNHQHGIRGADNSSFKGGRRLSNYGYVLVLSPENSRGSDNYVLEHRLKMEEHLGRKLLPTEDVHHKDEDKTNNDIDNLELCTRSMHSRRHYSERQHLFDRDTRTGRYYSLPFHRAYCETVNGQRNGVVNSTIVTGFSRGIRIL